MKPQEILIKWMRYKATIAKKRSYFTPKDAEVIRGWSDERALAVVAKMCDYLDVGFWGTRTFCPFCIYAELFYLMDCSSCGYRINHNGIIGIIKYTCGEPYNSMIYKEKWYSDEAKEKFRQLFKEVL